MDMTFQISAVNMRSELEMAGVPDDKIFLGDDVYVFPEESWVLREFASILGEWERKLQLAYEPECWDCDNFNVLAALVLNLCHAKNHPEIEAGVGYGLFWYEIQPGERHALCIYGQHHPNPTTGRLLSFHFWEPQTKTPVLLGLDEITSCKLCLF